MCFKPKGLNFICLSHEMSAPVIQCNSFTHPLPLPWLSQNLLCTPDGFTLKSSAPQVQGLKACLPLPALFVKLRLFEFINLLPQSPQHWNYIHVPLCVKYAFNEHDTINEVNRPGRVPVAFSLTASLGPQCSLCPQPELLVAQWLRSSLESPSSQPPVLTLAQLFTWLWPMPWNLALPKRQPPYPASVTCEAFKKFTVVTFLIFRQPTQFWG